VPTKTYRTLDLDDGDRLSRLSDRATFWGMTYWREMARAMAAIGLMTHAWHREAMRTLADARKTNKPPDCTRLGVPSTPRLRRTMQEVVAHLEKPLRLG
jgi:hypothetical protein